MWLSVCLCLFIVLSVDASTDYQEDFRYEDQTNGNIRDKRTLGLILQTFADVIGYDVQKRPSILPLAPAPSVAVAAPAPPAPAVPPKAPIAPPLPPAPKAPTPAAPRAPAPPVLKTPVAPKMPPAPAAPPAKAPMAPPAAPMAPPAAPPAKAPAPPAPAAPPAPGAPPAPPRAPPLLTETIQKMFNLNFNWNRNVQPSTVAPAVVPNTPAASPPKAPPAIPRRPPPRQPPPPAAPAPTAPAAPVPKAPGPPPAPKVPPPAPAPSRPRGKVAPTRYYQESSNVEDEPNTIQDNDDYADNQQQIYYDQTDNGNEENEKENLQNNDYDYPQPVQVYWQNSPWTRNKIQNHNKNPEPEYQEFTGPDGERGYRARYYHQNAHLDQKDHNEEPVEDDAEYYPNQGQEEHQNFEEAEAQRAPVEEEDINSDSSKSFMQFKSQPQGFQPNYNQDQSGYYHPGLPLAVHGVQEDKVLVAWPAPFEIAGSELKSKQIAPKYQDRDASASENQEYVYEPDSYGQYTFFEIPEPVKYEHAVIKEPQIEAQLSKNAKVSERNYGKKITNVQFDRHTFHH